MDKAVYVKAREELMQKLLIAKDRVARLETAIRGLDVTFKEVGGRNSDSKHGASAEAIRDAVQKMGVGVPFTVKEIRASLEVDHPTVKPARTTISGVLVEMASHGDLIVTSEAKGRRPAQYRRKEMTDEPLKMAQ